MSHFTIRGGKPLSGSLRVQGAKNSALPLLAAAVLCEGVSVLHNCPDLTDIRVSEQILRELGCRVWREGDSLYVDASGGVKPHIPARLMGEMRSSVIFLGALLARTGEANLFAPGGCEIGARPIDLHLAALRQLGAEIDDSEGSLCCRAARLRGARIELALPSVGATENVMLAACLAEGVTVLRNAAREPEIEDLQRFLRRAGARISGAGSSEIRIQGVKRLCGTAHRVQPDRIAAATWLSACAAAGGEICLYDTEPWRYRPVLQSLYEMGCSIACRGSVLRLRRRGRLTAPRPIVTRPYPGFPTDAQPLLMAACLRAEGGVRLEETIFENRFHHVPELQRLGASLRVEGNTALIRGVPRLIGADLFTADLRGGAALTIAALTAQGESRVFGLRHIDRGYCRMEESLRRLGAEIERTEDSDGTGNETGGPEAG